MNTDCIVCPLYYQASFVTSNSHFIYSFAAVSFESQDCRLTIHWENGFTLSSSPEYDVNQVIWHYPFEKLRMSSDDGKHLLWLDFGEEDGEKVSTPFFIFLYLS